YHLTAWTNTYGKGRVFGTTIGHHNETIATEEYLDLVTRGLLWTAQKLTADGSPAPGFASAAEAKRLVLVAGRPSHARGAHEHNAGVQLFAQALASVPGLEVVTVRNGWPNDPSVLETADGILFFMDGGGRHPAIQED